MPALRFLRLSTTIIDSSKSIPLGSSANDLAWSLRLNQIDGPTTGQPLIEIAEELFALNSQSIRTFTIYLLDAYGGSEAAEKIADIGETFRTREITDLIRVAIFVGNSWRSPMSAGISISLVRRPA